MNVIQYDQSTGVIHSFSTYENDVDVTGPGFVVLPEGFDVTNVFSYLVNPKTKELVLPETYPGIFYLFDFENENWKLNREAMISSIKGLVNQNRYRKTQTPIEHNGFVFDADPDSITNLQSVLAMCANGMVLPDNFLWRDANNNNHPMTVEGLKNLAGAIFQRSGAIYSESWALKDSLPNKTDEELLAIYDSLTQTTGV